MSAQKGWLHDFSRGLDTWIHQIRLGFFSSLWTLLGTLIVGFIVSLFAFFCLTTSQQRYWYWVSTQAAIIRFLHLPYGVSYVVNGQEKASPAWQIVKDKRIKKLRKQVHSSMFRSSYFGLTVSLVLFVILVLRAHRRGKKLRRDELIRGGRLCEDKELASALKEKNQDSYITLGRVPMIRGSEPSHLFVAGAPGVGKSVLISSMLIEFGSEGSELSYMI